MREFQFERRKAELGAKQRSDGLLAEAPTRHAETVAPGTMLVWMGWQTAELEPSDEDRLYLTVRAQLAVPQFLRHGSADYCNS